MATGPPEAEPNASSETHMSPGQRFSSAWHTVAGSKVGKGSKKGFDWTWKKVAPVGEWMNKTAGSWGVEGFWPVDMPRECEKCARILWTFAKAREEEFVSEDPNSGKKTQKILKRIPPEAIEKAEGLAIYTVWRMGLGVSAASGSGIVIARDSPTSWGPPSGILVHTIGWGFLAGTDVYDVVLVLRNKKAVEAFCKPKISIGTEIAAVAGPQGTGASLSMGLEAAPVWSYTKSKGLYGGIQLDGNAIISRDDENERFYGRRYSAKELLTGGYAAIPRGASSLLAVIEAAEGKSIDESILPPDIDVAPSDMPAAHGPNSQAAAATAPGAPTLPARRHVPPPPYLEGDPQEEIKLRPGGEKAPAPPPRPPRRLLSPNSPSASPRASGEHPRPSSDEHYGLSGEHARLSGEHPLSNERRLSAAYEGDDTPKAGNVDTFAPANGNDEKLL